MGVSAVPVRSLGFNVWSGEPAGMPAPHAHTDIEGNYLLSGSMKYLHGGREYLIGPGRLTLFWAGIPHRLIEVDQCRLIWIVLPLAWYLQWQLPGSMTQRLLAGEMVFEGATNPTDATLFAQWREDMQKGDADLQRIAVLEVEARIRRMAHALHSDTQQQGSSDSASATHAERLAAFMAANYRQPLSATRIAEAVSLHPNYAMQLFKHRCGMGMWEYLIRLRISHAERLLLTTDWKVQRIAMESGFSTAGRFYDAFARIAGCTPREYRARKRGGAGE